MIIPKGTVVTIDGKVYRTLEAQVAWNKEELESLDIEALEALPDQFTELQENVSALSDSVADVTEDVGGLESDMTDAQSDISGLKTRMTTAETNIGLNAGEISQLQFDVGQAQGDITALGNSKLNKPTNTGEVGDVIVKTANGTEYQAVAPFNPNGTYPNVTAGKAISAKSLENVSEDSGATQTAPFFFQATATANNTEETPTSPVFELKSIRGNTIVYNQLVDGMSTSYPTISGHTYWAFHSGQPPVIVVSQGTPISFPSPQSDKLVDLTRWFNGSIPQAILDDPTVFPVNYYDDDLTYSAGELKNCSCTEFKTVGFNALKVQPAILSIPPTHIDINDATRVLPNENYCLAYTATGNGRLYIASYDRNGDIIEELNVLDSSDSFYWYYNSTNKVSQTAFDTNKPTENVKFFKDSYIVVYYSTFTSISNCNLNLSWDNERNGEYAPYISHTYPMVWSGKSAGTAYDEKLPDGTEITRIGSYTFTGSETWTISGSYAYTSNLSMDDGVANSVANSDLLPIDFIGIPSGQNKRFIVYLDTSVYDTQAKLQALTTGKTVYYALSTPTTSEGTPYTSEIEGDDYGTMAFDSVVPVGNEFFYPADYSLLIDDLGNYTGYDVTKLAKKSDLIPAPTGDGTYTLKATVSGGTVTYTWEAVS